jgi:hypothetical protein
MSAKSFVNSLHIIVKEGTLLKKKGEKEKQEGKVTLEYFYVELL